MKKILFGAFLAWSVVCMSQTEKLNVYVDDFESGVNAKISEGGLDELRTRIEGNLIASRKYHVLERRDLDKLQKEFNLVDAGMTEGTAPESNRLKAAGFRIHAIVLQCRGYQMAAELAGSSGSSVEAFFGTVEIQLRIANIQSSEIHMAKTIEIKRRSQKVNYAGVVDTKNPTHEAMVEAIRDAAKEVVSTLNDVAFPVYVTDVDGKFVTGNVSAEQVTMGETWEIWRRRGRKINPETGKMDGYREKLVGNVKVARVGGKECKFEVLNPEEGKELEEYFDSIAELPLDKLREKGLILRKAPESLQDSARNSEKNKKRLSSLEDM